MGAGAVAGHAKDSEISCSQTSPVSSNKHTPSQYSSQSILAAKSQMKMSCEVCSVNFSIFKRKKFCQECRRYFCSNCLPKPPSNSVLGRQCNKCKLLVSGRFSRDDLQTWKVKDMTCFLNARNISTKECREKHDLIELVLAQFCKQPRLSLQDQEEHENLVKRMAAHVQKVSSNNESLVNGSEGPSTSTQISPPPPVPLISETLPEPPAEDETTGRPTQEGSEGVFEISAERLEEFLRESVERLREAWGRAEDIVQTQEEDPLSSAIRRTHIDDITSVQSIEELSIRQLKELLVNNFVDYRGCCEKPELIDRVKRLWSDHQANKAKAEKIHKEEELAYYGNTMSQNAEELADEAPSQTTEASQSASTEVPDPDQDAEHAPATTGPPSNLTEAAANAGKQIEDSLCHICMDSLVDCILLECGHMVTCTQCGKRLADCPICRQYIVRVVRVFRS